MRDETFEGAVSTRSGRGRSSARTGAGSIGSDRLPPYSQEAEAALLGCLLCPDNEEAHDQVEQAGLSKEWFYDLRHQTLWHAIVSMRDAGAAIDLVTLCQWLRERQLLEQVGGLEYVAPLPELTPSAANAPAYIEILYEQFLLREVLRSALSAAASAYSIVDGEKSSASQLVDRLEREIGRLSEAATRQGEQPIAGLVAELMPELEDYHRGRAQIGEGVTTGLLYLDKLLCGMGGKNGNYVVFSGRPATGKTSLAMQVAMHAAMRFVWWDPIVDAAGVQTRDEQGTLKYNRQVGIPVGVFSYEMAADALVRRMLFAEAGADMQRWRTGFAEADDIQKLVLASHTIGKAKIFIDDNPGPIESLRARARRMYRQLGIKLFVIDYLQLLKSSRRSQDRVQELAFISNEIQALGKALNVPFIVIAQMNRDYEKDQTRAPRLSDLKDCGSIEQDADVVGFLYSPRLKEKDKAQYESAMESAFPEGDWSKRPSRVNILIAKNRYGPSGKAELLFQKSSTIFFDWIEWLKNHGQKELAQGESRRAQESGAVPTEGDDSRRPGDGEEEQYDF